jgi:hypothetical protein
VLLAGCSTLYKQVDPEVSLDDCRVDPGTTHYHQVLDELGPPTRLTALPDGFAFIYESLTIRELQLGIGGREGLLQLLKLSLANTDLYRRSLVLHFDAEGVLVAHGRVDSKEDLGMGGSIQPLFSVQQITDTSDYEDDAIDAAGWGMSLLGSLPVTLNTPQRLNSGATGLEQSGTTTKVGQHTLEMRR